MESIDSIGRLETVANRFSWRGCGNKEWNYARGDPLSGISLHHLGKYLPNTCADRGLLARYVSTRCFKSATKFPKEYIAGCLPQQLSAKSDIVLLFSASETIFRLIFPIQPAITCSSLIYGNWCASNAKTKTCQLPISWIVYTTFVINTWGILQGQM